MINFEVIRWQNLLSTGNQWTELNFQTAKNTLIIGKNGGGKCLDPSTRIKVAPNNYLPEDTTVGAVVDLYRDPDLMGSLKVSTRYGFKTIEAAALTAHNSEVYEIETVSGVLLRTSPDHLMLAYQTIDCDRRWIKTKDLTQGDYLFTDTPAGFTEIHSVTRLDYNMDLYDLQVAEVKEFYANGLVSHNSTLLDAITYGLFGRPYRNINKPQLINSITQKNLLVEIEFSINKIQYLVRRGMRPGIFEIYQNDVLINQNADTKDYQDLLEKILKMNFKSFIQIVILGSANYVPFMQLPAGERRAVIEDLLDIQVFSVMNNLLKEKIAANKSDVQSAEYDINLVTQKIESHKKHLESLRTNNKELIEVKRGLISDLESKIKDADIKVSELFSEIESLQLTIADKSKVDSKKTKILDYENKLETKLRSLKKELSFFDDNDTCPTCTQAIDELFKTTRVEARKKQEEELNKGLDKLHTEYTNVVTRLNEISEVNQKITSLNKDLTNNQQDIRMWSNNIELLKTELDSIKNSTTQLDSSKDELLSLISEKDEKIKHKYSLIEQRELLDVSASLLKDSGIKTRIIKQYIPVINKLVNKYLALFDFFVAFELDEKFNETIKSRHRDIFSYASFSEGEKFRVNISLMLTWRAIAKLRNSVATNLLIMDEVFDSSSDVNGIDCLQNILESMQDDNNIFVISHNLSMQDKFENVIKFEKVKNFSRIVES